MIFHNGNQYDFAIHIDPIIHAEKRLWLGAFNFIIDEVFIPGINVNFTLSSVVISLKYGFECAIKNNIVDIGEKNISFNEINLGTEANLIYLKSELSDEKCLFRLGYSGNTERFFYSTDFGKTFKEKRLPRGTVEAVIRMLPDDGNPLPPTSAC